MENIRKLILHPVISGSTIVVAGTFFVNILNYLFNLAMGNLLTVSEYGLLASLISVVNIISVLSSTAILVFTKLAAQFYSQDNYSLLGRLFRKGSIVGAFLGVLFTIFFVAISPLIGSFLHIKELLLLNLVGILMFFILISSVPSGILQGMLKFIPFSIINIVSGIVKLITGVLLVLFGLKVFGAVFSFLVASVTGYIFYVYRILGFLRKKKQVELKDIRLRKTVIKYGIPAFFSTLTFTSLYSLDIIMVRNLFSEQLSGQYAALSLMGRSIFFLVSPVATVMLPVVAQKVEKKEAVAKTLFLAGFLIFTPSLLMIVIYQFYPELIISIFFRSQINSLGEVRPLLGLFALFMLLYSMCFLLNNYFFSIGKTKIGILSIFFVIMEVVFITLFHSSLFQVVAVLVSVTVMLLLFYLLFLLYYTYVSRRQ